MIPGQIMPSNDPVEINAGLPVTTVRVTSTSDIPIHLTAHFHVFEANPRLALDRQRAWGMRLDVPANGSVRFEPGETKEIALVPIGGKRIIHGFNGAVDGPLDATDIESALSQLVDRGFLHQPT